MITDFITYKMSVEDFEKSYLQVSKNDSTLYGDEIYKVLGTLFSDVDAYCGDPEIANYDNDDPFRDIDEAEPRQRAREALAQLKLIMERK